MSRWLIKPATCYLNLYKLQTSLPVYCCGGDTGVKEVLLPADNLKEAQGLPPYILDAVKLTPVNTIDEVLKHALLGVE